MKPQSRFLAFLLLLTLLPVSFAPAATAGHLTWTTEVIDTFVFVPGGAPGTAQPEVAKKFGSTVYVGTSNWGTTPDDLVLYKSTDNGESWTGVGQITGSWDDFGYDFEFVDANTVVACYIDGGAVKFRSSSTGGGLWSSAVTVSTNAVSGVCDIIVFPTTYAIVYSDNVEGDIEVRRSSDSWASEIDILTTDQIDAHGTSYRNMQVAQKNSTSAMLAFLGGASNDGFTSITTDSGATWSTPVAIPDLVAAGSSSVLDLRYVENDRYDVAGYDGANIIYCTSASSGSSGSWSCNTGVATASVTSLSLEVNPTDTTEIIIAWTVNAVTTPLKYSFSTDTGANWDAAGSVRTYGVSQIAQRINSLVMPNGDFGLFYHSCKLVDETTDVSCNDASADRVQASLSLADFADLSETIGASATATVTGLVGFDVSPDGSIAIIRSDDGGHDNGVSIYNAQTLTAPVGGPIATNCAVSADPMEDGVMAKHMESGNQAQLVAFVNCDVTGDAQYLSIRQSNGDIPTAAQFADLTGEECTPGTGGTECAYNIQLSAFTQDSADNNPGQLGQVRDFPIDYSNNDEEVGFDNRMVAWAWASQQCANTGDEPWCDGTEPGEVGVSMFTSRTDPVDSDQFNADSAPHHPTQDVDDFCIGLDAGSYYLASVVSGQPGHTWAVTFSTGSESDTQLDATISTNPSTFGSSGYGVACGGGQILHQNGDDDVQLLTRNGIFVAEVELAGGVARGLSISDEFIGPEGTDETRGETCTTALEGTVGCVQYGVYVDGATDEGVILNLTGGNMDETGRFALPSGTFHSIRMDRNARNVWVATTTTVARFEVVSATTVVDINIPGEPTIPDGTDDDALFSVPEIPGVSESGNKIIAAIFCMGLFMGSFGTIPTAKRYYEGRRGTDAVTFDERLAFVGLIIGFVFAWQVEFLTVGAVFVSVVLAAALIGGRWWKVSQGGT